MKEWKKPTIGNLTLSETKQQDYCSAQATTLDGHHTTKCHHGLANVNAGNCQYFTRPGGMCSYLEHPILKPEDGAEIPDFPTS